MNLVVDIKNGIVAIGVREEHEWLEVRRFSANLTRTSDEYALLFSSVGEDFFHFEGRSTGPVWISSVVPLLTPIICEAVGMAFGLESRIIGPGVKTGMKVRTDLPSEVGSDLVCACVAARQHVKGACIVVDSGTALTFSAINRAGDFVGVVIAPGIETSASSLRRSTAQLPLVQIRQPERCIGRSTVQSIQSGIFLGYEGLITRIIGKMSAELDPEGAGVSVVGTGDSTGRSILESCGYPDFVPDLGLLGIVLISELNQGVTKATL